MRNPIATLIVVLICTIASVGAGGCNSKPPPEIDSAVRKRLARYSQAWQQGDAGGVRESFHARDAGEIELLEALAELAPAQAELQKAYQESLGSVGRILFSGTDADELVINARQWDSFARSAANPHRLIYKKPIVIAQLHEKDDETSLHLRPVDGQWKIDLDALLMGDAAPELAQAAQREVAHTKELTDAIRSGDTSRVRQVVLRQVIEVRGPARRVIEDVLATRPTTRAKENPP